MARIIEGVARRLSGIGLGITWPRFTERYASFARWFNGIGLGICMPLMVSFITVDVIGRKFFNRPLLGADEAAGFALLIMTYSALTYCWIVGGHIRLDMLVNRLKPRLRQACEALGAAAWLLFFGLFLFWSIKWVVPDCIAGGDVSHDARIILWPFKTFIIVGCLSFSVQLVISFITAIKKGIKNEP